MAEIQVEQGAVTHQGEPCASLFLGEAAVSLGRGDDNDLVCCAANVSRNHARIEPAADGAGHTIRDLGSRNGTRVNGRPVESLDLDDGDRIGIGDVQLLYHAEESGPGFVVVDEEEVVGRQEAIELTDTEAQHERDHLGVLAHLSEALGSFGDAVRQRRKILDLIFSMLDVDRALLALRDEQTGKLVQEACRRARRSRAREDVVRLSATMVSRVVDQGVAIVTEDAAQDFPADSVTRYRIGSAMCAPLRFSGQVVGLLYVDSVERRTRFGPADQNFFLALAGIVSATLESNRFIAGLRSRNHAMLQSLAEGSAGLVYCSEAMERTVELAMQYARSRDALAPVLISGEPGTGKSHLARFLHRCSPRASGPMLTVNCAGITQSLAEDTLFGHRKGAFTGADQDRAGVFQEASGGTLLLDEVGELPLEVQAKLLVALREGEVTRLGDAQPETVDVRVIAATNRDLPAMVAEGSFRRDLYDRLSVLPLVAPPLRERREDIPLLARHFLLRFAGGPEDAPLQLEDEAEQALRDGPWEGNVAALENCVRRLIATATGPRIGLRDLPPELRTLPSVPEEPLRSLEEVEREHIAMVLDRTSGNRRQAAAILGIHRDTLAAKIKRHELDPGPEARGPASD